VIESRRPKPGVDSVDDAGSRRGAPRVGDETELAAHVKATLANFKCPARWVFVDTLPRSSTGKVGKRALRDWLAAGAVGSPPE
jgi:acyl-coenzyme A synthetase/AMP-(fatty) acid ligase